MSTGSNHMQQLIGNFNRSAFKRNLKSNSILVKLRLKIATYKNSSCDC